MPIRKIPKNHRNVTGVAASGKAVGDAQFESTLERDFLDILELSPDIERFEVQPLKITWIDKQGDSRSYTPDVLVEFKQELNRPPWLCEVKYRNDIKKDWLTLHPKFLQGIRAAKEHHWRFRLITETEIRTAHLVNVRFLIPFKFRVIPEAHSEQLLARLRQLGKTTPTGILRSISPAIEQQAELLPALWQLLAHHRVAADLEIELTMDSPIWSVS